MHVLLEGTPPGIDPSQIREHILRMPGVVEVHDLHVTQIATGLPVLTAHVVLADEVVSAGGTHEVLDRLQECVSTHFRIGIEHSTFQIEPAAHRGHEHHLAH